MILFFHLKINKKKWRYQTIFKIIFQDIKASLAFLMGNA